MGLRGCGLETGFMWDLDLERSLEVKSHTITPWCKVKGCYYRAVTGEYRGGGGLVTEV